MRKLIWAPMVALVWLLPAAAETPKQVEITGPFPLPIEAVSVDALPPVELAPDQSVRLVEEEVAPNEIIIRQAFLGTSAGSKLVSFSEDVILRTIIVVPGSIDSDPNLHNCQATVRWKDLSQLHPNSNDRYILDHNWGGTNQIPLNYSLPYRLRLPAGQQLEAIISRVGTSGFCEGIINFTGTVAAP